MMSVFSSSGSSSDSNSSEGPCEAERILGKKTFRRKTYYLIKWFGKEKATWEAESDCNCQHLIARFESNRGHTEVDDESEDEWEVEAILQKRIRKDKVEYLVKWKGWPGEPTWELAENCECINLIAAFENPKLRRLWDFEGSNKNLWLDRRSMLRYMRRIIRKCPGGGQVNLLRFKDGFPENEKPFDLMDGLNVGPLCYKNHWYLVLILVNHINTTRQILVGDSLNTLIGTNKQSHPVVKRLQRVYSRFQIKPIAFTQMERSDVCAYYILAGLERAIFLMRPSASCVVDCIYFDPIRAELIRSEYEPTTNHEISVALPIPEAFDVHFVCEFCKTILESRKMVDIHIRKQHFTPEIINID